MSSYFELNFIEKFFWESDFYFGQKVKWHEIKISYLAAIFKRYNIYFFSELWFVMIHIYGENFIAKFRWQKRFSKGGSMDPPLGINGSKSTLVT